MAESLYNIGNMIDAIKIKTDFPVLKRRINGKSLVYLDSAATSQKPQVVIDAMVDYYQNHNANIHRGVHTLGDESTRIYESARETIVNFIGASDPQELIFVRNTTEAINLVAYAWGRQNIDAGDEILVSEMEHHSNLVPWQVLAEERKAILKYIRVDDSGKLDLQDLRRKLSVHTKLLAVSHVSNFLGTINPIREIAALIKEQRTKNKKHHLPLFLVDGAQAVPHMPVDVKDLGCDFYAFSGHKMYGPMGIGCLWGRRQILEAIPPFLTGGGMISAVDWAETAFANLPDKFEAGTPNVADAVGLAAAVQYLQKIGMGNVRKHEIELTRYLIKRLSSFVISSVVERSSVSDENISSASERHDVPSLDSSASLRSARNDGLSVTILGPKNPNDRGGLVAFTLRLRSGQDGKEIHAHDVAQVLDSEGVAVRSGHHCVMPLHTKLGLSATTRISFGIYNTREDLDKLIEALEKIVEVFGK